MKNFGKVHQGVAVLGVLILVAAGLFVVPGAGGSPGAAPAGVDETPPPITVFSAPSHLPAGENWVIIGSKSELPVDFTVSAKAAGVQVLETLPLSARAFAVRVDVPAVAAGDLLTAQSALGGINQDLAIQLGQLVPSLAADANLTEDDLTNGNLVVPGKRFVYGYVPASEGGLSAIRIHNRQTGVWVRREHASEKAREAAELAARVLAPGFEEVDEEETLPDTDGDGIPDFDEPAEERERAPEPDFIGVRLASGLNELDIVSIDEYGNASWRTLEVFATWVPPVAE